MKDWLRRHGWDLLAALLLAAVLVPLFYPWFRFLLTHPDRILCGKDIHYDHMFEQYTRDSLRGGVIPFWNPYDYCGLPFFANNNALVFYPVSMLLRAFPVQTAMALFLPLHIWIAGFGLYRLCRRLEAARAASVLAAVGFMLGGAFAPKIYAGHITMLASAAWIPWVMDFAVASVRRPSWLPHPGLVIALVLQYLAGFTQTVIYTIVALSTYMLAHTAWRVVRRGLRQEVVLPLAQLTLCGLFFLFLSAFQFLPMKRMYDEAGRTGGLDYGDTTKGSLSVRHLKTFFWPLSYASSANDYNDPYSSGGLWEKCPYAGKLVLLFLPFSFWRSRSRREALFFVGLGVVAALFALGEALPLYRLHYAVFPMLRIPGRLLPFWGMGAALGGALGLSAVVEGGGERSHGARLAAVALAMGTFAVLAAPCLAEATRTGRNWRVAEYLGDSCRPIVWLAAGLAALVSCVVAERWLHAYRTRTAAWLAAAALLLAGSSGEMQAFARRFIVASPAAQVDPALVEGLRSVDIGRFFPLTECSGFESRVPNIDGKTPLYLAHYADFGDVLMNGAQATGSTGGASLGSLGGRIPEAPGLLRLMGVTHILAPSGLGRGAGPLRTVWEGEGRTVIESDLPAPRAFWTDVVETRDRLDAIRRLIEAFRADTRLSGASLAPQEERRPSGAPIQIRFTPGVGEARMRELERKHGLIRGEKAAERTWNYLLTDVGNVNVRGLISDPRVQDTQNIDRHNAQVTSEYVSYVRARSDDPSTWPEVKVRYPEGLGAEARAQAEMAYGLADGSPWGERTWRYRLKDTSVRNINGLISDRRIEDTDGIDRHANAVILRRQPQLSPASAEPPRQVRRAGPDIIALPPVDGETASVRVLQRDTPDGRLTVEVEAPRDGYLFTSEVYYPERSVRVDGRKAEMLRMNIAFTGVAVPQGRHTVELRYDPSTFYGGLALGALAIVLWVCLAVWEQWRMTVRTSVTSDN